MVFLVALPMNGIITRVSIHRPRKAKISKKEKSIKIDWEIK